jgi:YD repeat-containing protein
VGQLTSESFTGSGNLSGSYAYTYDARGQQIGDVTTVNGTGYTTQTTYNDAGQPLTETYPTGETVTPGYSSTGWLTGMTTSAGGTTTLASNITYSGLAGAGGQISSMSLGNGTYIYSASYDTGQRLTSAGLTTTSSGTQLYQTQPTYDAVSNIVGVQTSVGSQTDTQQFCYDNLNHLTWSGTNGTPPCSGAPITAGTLTGAQYQQSDSYNVDGGLTVGPKGNYTYGDSSHPHAVTSTSSGYSASYDAAGNMICRATSNTSTCSGSSPTGQQLSYDAQGRLSSWQNQPTLPGQMVNYLYDGEGHRVAMQSNVSGTTTLTAYIGSIEEVQTSASTTQTTTFYAVGSKRVAADVNGTFYYFGYDALGSQVAVLNATGSLVGAQLYGPYGASRYTTGTIPTSIGFTG